MPDLKAEAKDRWPDWEVYLRDGCKCVYCKYDGTGFAQWGHLQIDHVIPIGRGGPNTPENKVVACGRCNSFKGRFDPSGSVLPEIYSNEWREQMIKIAFAERISPKVGALRKDYAEMMADLARRQRD